MILTREEIKTMARSIGSLLKIDIAECPECMCKIPFYKSVQFGQIVYCPECLERLAVCRFNPTKLCMADDEYFDEYEARAGDS